MTNERIYYPQNGEFINLYVLRCDGVDQHIFLNRVQAEAAQRLLSATNPGNWGVQHRVTEPCDNTC